MERNGLQENTRYLSPIWYGFFFKQGVEMRKNKTLTGRKLDGRHRAISSKPFDKNMDAAPFPASVDDGPA